MAAAAASSSSSQTRQSCQVFLSFRGADVRNNFLSHLYTALDRSGIYTYIDSEELRMGEEISSTLMKAIEESRIAIVVFSKDYASSTWCLEEVAKIMERKVKNDLIVFPVFYKMEPREVRTPRDEQSYAIAMADHEKKFGKDSARVNTWKKALFDAGNLSGREFTVKENESEAGLIQEIVDETMTQLDRTPLDVAEFPTGIDSRAEEVKAILKLQSKDDVLMVGLWGQGGVGKTTLAKAIYNAIFRDFQGSCFLERVRENSTNQNGLVHLQEQLLSQVLLGKNIERVFGVDRGSQLIQERLCEKRVLVILDDVDHPSQLSALARSCEWFGEGSRIIVTTRDTYVVTSHWIPNHTYDVKVLNDDEALKLFRNHASLGNQEIEISSLLVDQVLQYAKCLPLALKVLGSSLRCRGESEWKDTLLRLAKRPIKEISDVLRVSHDRLDDNEKEIFLDIACCFKGRSTKYIKKVLSSCGFNTTIGVQILIERSLISEEGETLQMHDSIQSMGKEIARERCPNDPGKYSRLWLPKDLFEVISREEGTEHAEAIVLELPEPKKAYFSPEAFTKMKKLRLLVLVNVDKDNSSPDSIYLPKVLMWFQWPNCPLVPEFSKGPKKLVGLDMRKSKIKVPEQFEDFEELRFINYSECESLIHMPDLKCIPDLEELDLHGCKNLEDAHESLADHGNLRLLNLSGCSKLHDFPKVLRSKELQLLNLNLCPKLKSFPEIPDKMEGLRGLYLIGTSIEELPKSIENLVSLEEMDLRYCTKLRILPSSIYRFQNLERLIVEGCSKLVKFPKHGEDPKDPHTKTGFPKLYVLNLRGCNLSKVDFLESSCFPVLRALYLLGNNFATLPTCGQLHNLLWLDVSHTQQLQEIPQMPGQLRRLYAIGCESLSKFPPDTFEVQVYRSTSMTGVSSQNRLPSYSTSRRDASIFAP